jgi:ribosomal protein L40E
MPKSKTIFICEKCSSRKDTIEEAEKCEKSHYKPVSVKSFNYGIHKLVIPEFVTIEMKDEFGHVKIATYNLCE